MNISRINIKKTFQHKVLPVSVAAAFLLVLCGQQAMAHTRLTVSSTSESSSAHGGTVTAVNIPHVCGTNPVIGNVFFMPDTTDAIVQTSTDSFENFESPEGAGALDYLTKPVHISVIKTNDVFAIQGLIKDPLGNVLGFWAADGILEADFIAQLPIRIGSVGIVPESCATEVKIHPSIANICIVTGVDGIDGSNTDNQNVDFWSAPDVGTIYDGPDWSSPANYTVTRDLENNPLPASCGDGMSARIFPSANQLNRDMPVKIDGVQVWPAP